MIYLFSFKIVCFFLCRAKYSHTCKKLWLLLFFLEYVFAVCKKNRFFGRFLGGMVIIVTYEIRDRGTH